MVDSAPARYTPAKANGTVSCKAKTVTETANNDTAGMDVRRRKLTFRCWHRGTREMDLLLGRYVDRHIAGLSDADIEALEHLLEAPDPELFAWITGGKPVPENYDLPILKAIRDYHRDNPTADAV